MSNDPEPPRDVRVFVSDRWIPVECAYRGITAGMHRWVIARPLSESPVSISIGMLPANTSLSVEWSTT